MISSARERGVAAPVATLQDAVFLAAMTVLSLVSYVGRLGFYLDDYLFLRILGRSRSHSFLGLYSHLHAEASKARLRPVQIALLAGLYKLFGDSPRGYHVFNALVLVAGVLLVFLLFRELGQSRFVAVAVAVLYSTLPHFSTDRFWVAAFQANVSMTLYFASQYAALRAMRARDRSWPWWGLLMIVAAVGSVLAYEVALPLFLLTPLLVVYVSRHRATPATGERRAKLLLSVALLAFAAALAAKVVVAVRVGHESSYQLGVSGGFANHLAYLVRGAIALNVGSYGVALPYVVGWVLVHGVGWLVALLAVLAAVGVFLYLDRLARADLRELPSLALSRRLVAAGLVVVALGYVVFLTNSEIFFTSAGVDNRVNIAAAFGMAVVFVGLVAWVTARLSPVVRARVLAAALAMLAAAGFLVVNSLGSFWARAADRQQSVLSAVEVHLPAEPGRSTLLLDGTCPEIGPAIVFTTQYDLTGALFLRLHDPQLDAAVLSPHVEPRRRALRVTNVFNGHTTSVRSFPYGARTYVYDYARGSRYRLVDAAAARRYLRTRSQPSCPPIRSFDWGIPAWVRRFLP